MISNRIKILFIFLLSTSPLFANKNKHEPTRYINGEILAHHVSKHSLQKFGNRLEQEEHIRLRDLLGYLYLGYAFTPLHNPDRWQLENWIFSRPDGSVTPLMLMNQALDITKGDVQKGLILCWDVLREGWANSHDRNLYPRTLKLMDLTGEMRDFDGNDHEVSGREIKTIRGDNFSAWYHFFGTALNAYIAEKKAAWFPAHVYTNFLIFLEEKWFHNEFIDPLKRVALDKAGVSFGTTLAKIIHRHKTWADFQSEWQNVARQGSYITTQPDKFNENWVLKPNQHPRDYGTTNTTRDHHTMMERANYLITIYNKNELTPPLVQTIIEWEKHPLQRFALWLLAKTNTQEGNSMLLELARHAPTSMVQADAIEFVLHSKSISLAAKDQILTHLQFSSLEEIREALARGLQTGINTPTARKILREGLHSHFNTVQYATTLSILNNQAHLPEDLRGEAKEKSALIHKDQEDTARDTAKEKILSAALMGSAAGGCLLLFTLLGG